MRKVKKYLLVLCILGAFYNDSFSQTHDFKLGQFSLKNPFYISVPDTTFMRQWYTPVRDNVREYDAYTGKYNELHLSDTVYVFSIYTGKWAGKTGKWAEVDNKYVYLSDLQNINEKYIEDENNKDKQSHREYTFAIFLIFIAAIILVSLRLIIDGFRTSCPKCKKWFAKKLIKVTELGGSSYTYTTTQATSVYVDGKVGTAYVPVTKTGYTRTYKEHYRCKKCNYEWSKIKSS